MSRIETPPAGTPRGGPTDPFRYGYRFVKVTRPDGTTDVERVPLTLEDLLHPQEGDSPVVSSAHDRDCRYLGDAFQGRFAHRADARVFCDVGIYWDDPDLDHHNPDVSLILDIRHPRESWSSFNVAEEGVRPELIIEVVSPHYRENDIVTKVRHYHQVRVPYYVIVDREQDDGPARIIGYRYSRARYIALPLDEQGRLHLDAFGVILGTRDNRAVLYDASTGAELGDYVGVTRALEAEIAARRAAEERAAAEAAARAAEATARQAAEERAAAEAAARVAEATARHQAEQRFQAEATARQEAEQRAQADATARQRAEQRFQAEAAARQALEARLRQLEEELRRRNGATESGPEP